MGKRREKDFLGDREIPANIMWGIHTDRAFSNFKISSICVPASLISALAIVKKACCVANKELSFLDIEKANAIIFACDKVIAGEMNDQFPLDALQGGAGTSTNMNINEVIANRALEFLGKRKGDYAAIHPLEDVNKHQSTNDVYPTAVKVASLFLLRKLNKSVAGLQNELQKKEKEFAEIIKIGRTELQPAVPITLGAEFGAFAECVARDRWRTAKCEERLRTVNIGGTAVGTGLGAPRSYVFLVIEKLREITGLGLCRGENVMGDTANMDPFVEVSGIIKAHASNLIKISNDLRLLNMLNEIKLETLQAGSSIMPGKVNPVILESVIQAGIKVIANDLIVTETVSRASFQINEFMPLLAHAILESLEILINVNDMLAKHIASITANKQNCQNYLDRTLSIITAFLPYIGYVKCETLLKEFESINDTNLRVFLENKLGVEQVNEVLSPYNLLSLGYREKDKNG